MEGKMEHVLCGLCTAGVKHPAALHEVKDYVLRPYQPLPAPPSSSAAWPDLPEVEEGCGG